MPCTSNPNKPKGKRALSPAGAASAWRFASVPPVDLKVTCALPTALCTVSTSVIAMLIAGPTLLFGGAALLGVAPTFPARGIVEPERLGIPAPVAEPSAEPLGPTRALELAGATGWLEFGSIVDAELPAPMSEREETSGMAAAPWAAPLSVEKTQNESIAGVWPDSLSPCTSQFCRVVAAWPLDWAGSCAGTASRAITSGGRREAALETESAHGPRTEIGC